LITSSGRRFIKDPEGKDAMVMDHALLRETMSAA
jgi:hypothetical protein